MLPHRQINHLRFTCGFIKDTNNRNVFINVSQGIYLSNH